MSKILRTGTRKEGSPIKLNDPGVKVGISVIISFKHRLLTGIRKGSHGAGFLAFPGGSMKKGESFLQCSKREVKEETGLNIDVVPFSSTKAYFFVTNNPYISKFDHYVTIWMHAILADVKKHEPLLLEPNKCKGWNWLTLGQIRDQLPYGAIKLKKYSAQHPSLEWMPYQFLRTYRKKLNI